MVYLDHNATTPLDERVLEVMLPYLKGKYGNPSSVHALGREAREAMVRAREEVALLVNAHPSQLIFTSGGTEANNMAIKGIAMRREPGHLLMSAVEHASVREPMQSLKRFGWQLDEAGVDANGVLLEPSLLPPRTALLSVMWANNESGVIADIPTLGQRCREHGVLLHTDAVQAAGKVAVDFAASGAHLLSLSAHKLYGPKGIGALVVDKTLDMEPLLHGGGQERGRRGGTENIAAIVGFGEAARLARLELETRRRHQLELRQLLEEALLRELPQAVIFAAGSERLPNTVFFAVPGIEGQTLIMALDREGISVSSGSACGSEHTEPSHVLKAMGIDTAVAHGAIRISLGKENDERDIDTLMRVLTSQVKQLQQLGAATAW